MRDEGLYIEDMVEACSDISEFLKGKSRTEFEKNKILHHAVMYALLIIGEAASKTTPPLRARHPEIPWSQIAAFRNIGIHQYFGIDWDLVWRAATVSVPELLPKIKKILASEFPEEP